VAEFTAKDVAALRAETGAGMMECKKALTEADGDMERARQLLRERGLAKAEKLAAREAGEGVVVAYLHTPDPMLPAKRGVLLELNCSTDFVANTDEFRTLARNVAMHVAAARPQWISREDVPGEIVDREKEIYAKQAEGKPEHVVEKIVAGKLEDFFASYNTGCLLDQPYIKDDSKSVKQLLDELSLQVGEPVRVGRFARFEVGADGSVAGMRPEELA
jgi:elongation factor Ts